ncbi:MAG: RNA polymerase sigma factor [Candidatus Uhrbacteria bacterium]
MHLEAQQTSDAVRRAQTGDRDAMRELWTLLTPRLFGYLLHTIRDADLAADILQRSWLRAIESLHQYRDRGASFDAWMFAIARNECRQHWRRANRETPLDLDTHDVAAPDQRQTTENHIAVERALAQLPESDCEIIRLRYLADLPLSEVARVLGINPIAARVRLHRLLRRLRSQLEP